MVDVYVVMLLVSCRFGLGGSTSGKVSLRGCRCR